MSVRLACGLADRVAAIAPVAGVYFPPFSPDHSSEPSCDGGRPVPIVAFHGTTDDVLAFAGGTLDVGAFIRDSSELIRMRGVENDYMPDWAAYNGCATTPIEEQVDFAVRLISYEDCDEEADVQLYAIPDFGHGWPHPLPANELIWDFFEAHPLPAAASP